MLVCTGMQKTRYSKAGKFGEGTENKCGSIVCQSEVPQVYSIAYKCPFLLPGIQSLLEPLDYKLVVVR